MAGTDKSRSVYRGLLLMDPRITGVVASGNTTYSTSYTQQGEAFDTPVPAALTDDLVLQSSGTPEVAGQTFTVTTQRAGFPGPSKGEFVWSRRLAGVTTGPFGWDHPCVVEDWEALVYSDGSTYPATIREPDAVTLSDGTVLVCAGSEVSSGVFGILTWTRTPSSGTWASPVTVVTGTSNAHPCMVALPDDRVLLFYWTEDATLNVRNIRAYVTADGGATWSLHATDVLSENIDLATYSFGTRVGRLRCTYLNGDIALFGWLENASPTHYIFQWASSDLGASFSTLSAGAFVGMYPDCTTVGQRIVLGLLETTGDQGVQVLRLGSAFQPMGSSEIINIDPPSGDDFAAGAGSNVAGDLALWADEDGTLYIAVMEHSGANKEGLLFRSYDIGETWEGVGLSALGQDFGMFYRTEDTTPSYPTGLVGTHCRGSHVLLHNWVAPVGDEDLSLAAMWLGGYTTVTQAFFDSFKTRRYQGTWQEMWLPYELPSDTSVWTRTATGTEQLIAGALVSTTTAQTNYYSGAPSSSMTQGLAIQFELQCSIGGSSSSETVATRVVIGDSSHGFGLSIRCSTTGFRVYDHFGSALGAGATSVDMMTQWVQFRVYLASPSTGVGAYAVYYRANTKPGAPRAWVLVVSGDDLTDASASTSFLVRWGHLANTTSISRWRQFFWADTGMSGRIGTTHAIDGGQAASDLNGHDYAPGSIGVADGLKLRAIAGPTFLGSEWSIAPRYEYAIEKILPGVEPSPSEGWRGTTDDVEYIDLELSSLGDTEPLNDSIALYITGHNFGSVGLQKFDGGSWSLIGSADLLVDTGLYGLTYINNKGACRPGTGTEVGGSYFQFNELVGGVVRFGNSTARRITGNTEGFWQGGASGATKQMTITFEADGTEPASGADMSIQTPQALLIFHLAGANYQALRIRISDTYAPPEGYWTLNKAVVGPLVVFGKDSDWSRKYGLGVLTDIVENTAGNRRSRKKNRPRRSVDLPWTDGIDQTQVQGSDAASRADYVKGTSTSGGLPIALRNDTAMLLEGVVDYTGGGHLPVVYCPRILKGTPDTQVHVLRRLSMYGRILSDWDAEVVVGDEEEDELVRVPGLTISEER